MCAFTLLAATGVVSLLPAQVDGGATRIVDISVWRGDGGVTVFRLQADSAFSADAIRQQRIDGDHPRELLRLLHMAHPFRVTRETIADANVAQVRIGHHPELDPPELHFVFDLMSEEVELVRIAVDGPQILVEFATPASTGPEPPSPPAVAAPEPMPTRAPEPSPTPSPAETPKHEPAILQPLAEHHPAGSGPPTIDRIEATSREDGSMLVAVDASRPLAPYSVRELHISGNPPRHVLSFEGVDLGAVPAVVHVDDDNLRRIRVIHMATRELAEVRLVLELASTEVTVGEVTQTATGVTVVIGRN